MYLPGGDEEVNAEDAKGVAEDAKGVAEDAKGVAEEATQVPATEVVLCSGRHIGGLSGWLTLVDGVSLARRCVLGP